MRVSVMSEWRSTELQYIEKLQYLTKHYMVDITKGGITRKDEKAHNVKVTSCREKGGEVGKGRGVAKWDCIVSANHD